MFAMAQSGRISAERYRRNIADKNYDDHRSIKFATVYTQQNQFIIITTMLMQWEK